MLDGHGDDIYGHERLIVSNFSSNVYNRLDLSPLREQLKNSLEKIHSYPEPTGKSLVSGLAIKHEVSDYNICLTNGATEAIYTIAHAFRRCKAAIVIPTFNEYEDACRINEIEMQFVRNIYEADESTELLWICNPNNPTGSMLEKEKLISYAKAHPYITLVIDQSYGYFTRQKMLSALDALEAENIILLHSMTKQFAIPGLRLGYAIVCKNITDKLNRFRMPWSVNALALEAGKYLLTNDLSQQLNMEEYLNETQRFASELNQIQFITTQPTEAHFFLCKIHLKDQNAESLKRYLIEEHGILIRDAGNFRGLDDSYFRVATQSKEDNDILLKAIRQWVK